MLRRSRGAFPSPAGTPDQLWAEWIHDVETRAEAQRDAVRLAVQTQENAGIDIDGEETRRHFVATFIEGFAGVDADNRETITIRRRYEASVPRVIAALERTQPVFLDAARQLRSATDHAIKFTLPRPNDDGRHTR